MSLRCEDVRVELTALVAGELDAEVEAGVRAHLLDCDECARELDELTSTIAFLEAAPLQHRPAPDLERRVFDLASLEDVGARVSAAPLEADPPIDLEARALVRAGVLDSMIERRQSRWSKVSMVLAPSLAATALVTGVLATRWHSRIGELEDSFGSMGQRVATQQLTSFDTSNRASADLFDSSHANYHLVLRLQHFPVTPPGDHYEVWLSGTHGTVSAGSFVVRGPEDDTFSFMVGVDPAEYPHLEVSVEPDDGNPDHTGVTVAEANWHIP